MALAANALTTLDEAKTYLGIELDEADRDDEIERLINAASQIIENYCGRKLYYGEESEAVSGTGTNTLLLSRYPVLAVEEVSYYDFTLPSADYAVAEGALTVEGSWSGGIRRQPFLYSVAYTGGYVTPQQALDDAAEDSPLGLERTLPYDIEQACLELVAILEGRKAGGAVTEYRVGQVSERYASALLPWSTSQALDPYRALRI